MKLSVAIPTWEYNARGVEFLDDLLRTISIQTFSKYEVVISDHSLSNAIKNFCSENIYNLSIKYYRNEKDRGNGPSNTNNAISLCSGKIIKVMFQDDFLYDDESFEKIISELDNSDKDWLVCGCNHTSNDGHSFFGDMYPRWNENILNGVNTISSPSVVSFKRKVFDKVQFDPNLKMMMDCDFYYNMKRTYGDPIFLNDILVSNRIHKNQISQNYSNDIGDEIDYCNLKYNNHA